MQFMHTYCVFYKQNFECCSIKLNLDCNYWKKIFESYQKTHSSHTPSGGRTPRQAEQHRNRWRRQSWSPLSDPAKTCNQNVWIGPN